MEQWFAQYGFVVGNALLSGLGFAFAVGAPAKLNLRKNQWWWMVLWFGLLGYYVWELIAPSTFVPGFFNGISTASIAILYLYSRSKKAPTIKSIVSVFCLIVVAITLCGLFPINFRNYPSLFVVFIGQAISWLFFVLLAWEYRKEHMSTTLLLLAYANLQLPAGLMGKQGFGVDLVLLLAAKLSLIGAMYRMLGVRDAK